MLTLRDDQLAVFADQSLKIFHARLARHLRAMFSAELVERSDEALEALIGRVVARAAEYGISIERDVARFAEYTVFFGEGFDREPTMPWFGETLTDPVLQGTEKMDRIDTIVDDLYEQAGAAP
jgi:hypothetical protein